MSSAHTEIDSTHLVLPQLARRLIAIYQILFLRSSKANDLVKAVYGSIVPVLDGEDLSVRILVCFWKKLQFRSIIHLHTPIDML
jgi:hypothetical protein